MTEAEIEKQVRLIQTCFSLNNHEFSDTGVCKKCGYDKYMLKTIDDKRMCSLIALALLGKKQGLKGCYNDLSYKSAMQFKAYIEKILERYTRSIKNILLRYLVLVGGDIKFFDGKIDNILNFPFPPSRSVVQKYGIASLLNVCSGDWKEWVEDLKKVEYLKIEKPSIFITNQWKDFKTMFDILKYKLEQKHSIEEIKSFTYSFVFNRHVKAIRISFEAMKDYIEYLPPEILVGLKDKELAVKAKEIFKVLMADMNHGIETMHSEEIVKLKQRLIKFIKI